MSRKMLYIVDVNIN